MDRFLINNSAQLHGTVTVSGSKNATLPILATSLLTRDKIVIRNAPHLRDVRLMVELLQNLGVAVEWGNDGSLTAQTMDESGVEAPYEIVSKMRGSVCVLGPLLAKRHSAKVSQPGGCVIGLRPIDLHLKGLRALGATVAQEHGYVIAQTPKQLLGGEIFLGSAYGPTVLGTCNIMMAATLAKGRTIIENAACEPEVANLGEVLLHMGAKIQGAGTHRIVIEGVRELHGWDGYVIPDRIEAGTFVLAGALTRGEISVENCRPDHLSALFDVMRQAGLRIALSEDTIKVFPTKFFRAMDLTALPYPGFPTDLQAQWMTLMCQAEGISIITDRVFPDRFIHAAELLRMGAQIRREGSRVIIQGPVKLSGAPVMASDLRASAALVLAGLVAEGQTEVHRVYHIDRGYEKIEQKLKAIGGKVERVS